MTRLLLIAAPGMDWPSLLARCKPAALPHLSGLVAQGAAGWLTGAPKNEPLAAAAVLASGQLSEVNGVYQALEAGPGGLQPTGRASWRAPPVWATLERAGVSTGGVGWPAIRPGAGWGGVHIDDSFGEAGGRTREAWALPLRCAPASVREAIRPLRIHPADISGAMLVPLVPELAAIDQSRDDKLPMLAVAMARAASVQAAAAWLLTEVRPDAVFVHLPWLAEVRGSFGQVRTGPFAEVMDGAWRFLDRLVGRLAELAGEEAQVVLVSPGWRERPGLAVAAGPGRPAAMKGCDALDVAPSVLAAFGLVDPDLPGAPSLAAPPTGTLRSVPPAPEPPPPAPPDPELLAAVEAAGLAPPPPPPRRWAADGLVQLGLIVSERDPQLALDLARRALAIDPDHVGAVGLALLSAVSLEEVDALPALAEAAERLAPALKWAALAQGVHHLLRAEPALAAPRLREAEEGSGASFLLRVAASWLTAARPLDAERVFRRMLAADPDNASAEVGLSLCASARRDFMAAEGASRRAIRLDPGRPAPWLQLAALYAETGRRSEAAEAAETARRLGPAPARIEAVLQGRAPASG